MAKTQTKREIHFNISIPDGSRSLSLNKSVIRDLLQQNCNQTIEDFHVEETTSSDGKSTQELFVIQFA